jgi:hypothetical protein
MSTSRSVVVSGDVPPQRPTAADGGSSSRQSPVASRSHLNLQAAVAPASPSPTALARSASAEFEAGGSGVYQAPEVGGQGLGAPGRMVKPTDAVLINHYGSAPDAVARGAEGRVHSGRGALAAAVAGEDRAATY